MGGFVKEVPPKTYDILITGFDTCTAPHTADHTKCGLMQVDVVTLNNLFHPTHHLCRHENGTVKFWNVTTSEFASHIPAVDCIE